MAFYSNLVSTIKSPLTSLLSFSIRNGSSYGARFAIFLGANAAYTDEHGNTFMHKTRSHYVAEALMNSGVLDFLASRNNLGETPLLAIVKNGIASISLVQYLINKGADVNAQDSSGNTLMHYAISSRDTLLTNTLSVTPLLDVNIENNADKTPVDVLADQINAVSNAERVTLAQTFQHLASSVLRGHMFSTPGSEVPSPLVTDNFAIPGFSLLHFIAQKCNVASVQMLRANIDVKNALGRTPLMYAVDAGNVEAVAALRSAGADYRITDTEGFTAADYVVDNGPNAATITALLQPTPYELIAHSATGQKIARQMDEAQKIVSEQLTVAGEKLVEAKQAIVTAYNDATPKQKKGGAFAAIILAAVVGGGAYSRFTKRDPRNALKAT